MMPLQVTYGSEGTVAEDYVATGLNGKLEAKILSRLDGDPLTFTADYLRVVCPVEHKLRNIFYELEVQIYHKLITEDGPMRDVAALSVIFREGAENEFL
jgi:hypothetical protein